MKRQRQTTLKEAKPKRKQFQRQQSSLVLMPTGGPIERKFVDLNQATINVPGQGVGVTGNWLAIGAAQLCNGLAPGTASNQRIGRKVVMKSIYLRLVATGAVADSRCGQVRVVIVYDKQVNGVAPGIAATVDAPFLFNSFTTPNNLTTSDRFVTIFDKILPIIAGSTAGAAAPNLTAKKWFRKINLETIYNTGTAGTVADINTGAMYITFCVHGFAAGGVNMDYLVRTRFEDQ